SRRDFLCRVGMAAACACCLPDLLKHLGAASLSAPSSVAQPYRSRMTKASWWKPIGNERVQCELCPKLCKVGNRERGFCGVRENRDGVYYTLVYGSVAAANVDPIEKKPFFHFLPGSRSFSIATAGCNMNCRACQNWELSQSRPEQVGSVALSPDELARRARLAKCASIAYTYNEPVVYWEYVRDAAAAAGKQGVRSVVVSNGYINARPLLEVLRHLDAVKIDFKAMSEDFYRRYCSGTLKPVLETLKLLKRRGMWTEIVYLVIPTLNDSAAEIEATCRWVRDNLGRDVPVHFTRFYPQYQLKHLPPTPLATLEQCHKIGRQVGLHYVYVGNVPGSPAENTYCPSCGKAVIERRGYAVVANRLRQGRCSNCGKAVPGVWK
ncbi:MAG: AmmeMemoRadiSam system radical SAM enzyme, partial [Armatimonadetes bacterium]|nr:AmmeMemoRadiSam system radical SAM enzyme [Armatimonadota bacterium]